MSQDGDIRALCSEGALEEAFNLIVTRYSERLYFHVRPMMESHEDADDLVQEIFIKIWAALPTFRWESQLFTWVYRIATNEALNFLRRKKVRSALNFISFSELGGKGKSGSDDDGRPLSSLPSMADPDPYFDGDAAERRLLSAIRTLPPKQRQVFCLRYFDELPYEEISSILGSTVGSLKASYHIASEKLRSILQKEF